MSALLRVLLCLFCFCITSFSAQAGSFKVFPLKLTFDLKNKTALFRITNTGNTAVTVQLEGVQWLQNEKGEDQYEKTKDIIFFPKIVEVARGEERVVRVAYRGNPVSQTEKTYRLFAQELPQRGESSTALSFALRFSIPVFVSSNNTSPAPRLMNAEVRNGHVYVTVANGGTRHLIASEIRVEGFTPGDESIFRERSKGWYVLPRSRKVFVLPVDETACRAAQRGVAEVVVARKKLSLPFKVDRTQCKKTENNGAGNS